MAGWQPPAVKFHDFLNALASSKMGKQPGSDGALQSAVRRERKPHETNILGYEPGRSTAGLTATLRQVLSKAAEWGVGASVPRLMWRVLLMVSNMMMLRKLCFRKVCILNPSALFFANPVISRVAFICQLLRCRLPFCMLVVLVRVAWKALTCGTRYWTTHYVNLQVAGNWRESASCSPRSTVKPKRRRGLSGDAVKDEGCSIIYAGRMICTRWQAQ